MSVDLSMGQIDSGMENGVMIAENFKMMKEKRGKFPEKKSWYAGNIENFKMNFFFYKSYNKMKKEKLIRGVWIVYENWNNICCEIFTISSTPLIQY